MHEISSTGWKPIMRGTEVDEDLESALPSPSGLKSGAVAGDPPGLQTRTDLEVTSPTPDLRHLPQHRRNDTAGDPGCPTLFVDYRTTRRPINSPSCWPHSEPQSWNRSGRVTVST